MKHELTVEQNKSVSIKALYQWPTYSGLLEGLPTDRMNDDIIKNIKEEAKRHSGKKEIHVIEPAQTPIQHEGRYPFGNPMALPPMICVADLVCFQPTRDAQRDGSMLTVVWFQKDYAFPIDNGILDMFKKLPWTRLAEDFDY